MPCGGTVLRRIRSSLRRRGRNFRPLTRPLKRGGSWRRRSKNLKALKGQLEVAGKEVDEYKDLVKQTVETVARMEGNRNVLYESAEKYMTNSNDFLAAQNEAFKKDLAERQTKVEIVTGILNLGTKVRVTNFKAQAKNDMGLMLEAGTLLDGLKEYTDKLRPITTSAEEMKRIEDTEAAAKKYARSMTDVYQYQQSDGHAKDR